MISDVDVNSKQGQITNMLVDTNAKKFEVPESNTYVGVVADVIDLGKQKTAFGEKLQTRIVWLLNAKDSEGKPLNAIQQVSQSMHEKAKLFGIVKDILGTAPPVPYETEELIGKSRMLWIVKEPKANKPTEFFANIKAIMPLPAGTAPLAVPADYVRAKDKPVKTYGNQGSNNPAPAAPTAPPAQAPTPVPAAPTAPVQF
jgi:hypothetical protein